MPAGIVSCMIKMISGSDFECRDHRQFARQGLWAGAKPFYLGHNALISGRNKQDLKTALEKLSGGKGQVIGQACDVSNYADVIRLKEKTIAEFGSIDIWVNNAGLARTTRSIADIDQADVEAMISTNMVGQINGSRVAAAQMVEQDSGKIFNILGGGSDGKYFPGMGIYGATKRGLDYFSNALVKELKDTPVIVGKISTGLIATDAVVCEARDNQDKFNRSRKMMNSLVDQVETVAPWLVEHMLATEKSGTKIKWLSGGKFGMRMLKGRFEQRADQFERFGL